jgi:hypothetical protein
MGRPRGRMEWATFETIVRKIRAHVRGERFSLSFSGMGEPLLHPELERFIRHVSADAFTAFACNGLALTAANARRLRDAGLDLIYFSFNGDEPEVYARMMGGLSFDRVLGNLRQAIAVANGSRLKIRANVSVTRANQDRTSRIQALLQREGVAEITFSLCHNRGGNLRDPSVCATPPMPAAQGHCAVIQHTLFVDWQGRALLCDHDLQGEYSLGNLVTEPLEIVLARRQKLIDGGVSFEMCAQCNDFLKIGFHPLGHPAGGTVSDWIYELHRDDADPLADASPAMRWLYQVYAKENRTDRLVNRLIALENTAHHQLCAERTAHHATQAGLLEQLCAERTAHHTTQVRLHATIAALEAQLAAMKHRPGWRRLEAARRLCDQAGRFLARLRAPPAHWQSPGVTI